MQRDIKYCDECGSKYYSDSSEMANLCPDCSHYLYGYKNCDHEFKIGRCTKCFWNGNFLGLNNEDSNKAGVMTLAILNEIINLSTSTMTKSQLAAWNQIAIEPVKWKEPNFGKGRNGFWVVAVEQNKVVWYNDIVQGFNISKFSKTGTIGEYFAQQEDLYDIIISLAY